MHEDKVQELDGTTFDEMTRLFTTRARRRGILAGIGGGALAAVILALGPAETAAKKKKGGGGGSGGVCRDIGQSCSSGGDCCSDTCDIGQSGSLVCCTYGQDLDVDYPCGSDADCCAGGFCTAGSRCVFP
jgi:hypothetical protein